MEEIWKDVVGYEGLYQISNFGNVRSVERKDKFNRKQGGFLLKHGCKRRTMIAWLEGRNKMPDKFVKLGLKYYTNDNMLKGEIK